MTNKNLRMNLFKDFADAVRHHMAVRGYEVTHVEDDYHAAIMLYYKISRYTIEPRPRQVLKAPGFQRPPQHELGEGRYLWCRISIDFTIPALIGDWQEAG